MIFFPKPKSDYVISWFKNLLRIPVGVQVKFRLAPWAPKLPHFHPFLRLVYYLAPPPHVPSFPMHQTAIINSLGTHYSFNLKSLSPLFFWLTPTFPSKVSLNIPSRKPSLTYQPVSSPAPLPLLHFGQTCTMPPGPYTAYLSCYHYHRTIGLLVCPLLFCKIYEGRNPPWDLHPSICTVTSTYFLLNTTL